MSKRYYFVGYSHSRGFGNMFFEAEPYLNINMAQNEIKSRIKDGNVVIISISEIRKGQYAPQKEGSDD